MHVNSSNLIISTLLDNLIFFFRLLKHVKPQPGKLALHAVGIVPTTGSTHPKV